MRDFKVTLSGSGSRGPSVPITVTIENWGPERRFEAVLTMDGLGNPVSATVSVPRMGRGTVEVPVPDCGYESPGEMSAKVHVVPEGSEGGSEDRVFFRYLPIGWFDRLDPDLCGSLCRFAADQVSETLPMGDLMDDLAYEYLSLSGCEPRMDASDRFFRVSTPIEMREFGDCTPIEAAVSMIAGMHSRGYGCCLVRLGEDSYVGVSHASEPERIDMGGYPDPGDGYLFVRPYDGCRGVGLEVSMDLSASRLRHVLPMSRGTSASSLNPS